MTAQLTMAENQRQRIRQNRNHGQHRQGLSATWMDGGLPEVTVGREGLKHLGIDPPAAATGLMNEEL